MDPKSEVGRPKVGQSRLTELGFGRAPVWPEPVLMWRRRMARSRVGWAEPAPPQQCSSESELHEANSGLEFGQPPPFRTSARASDPTGCSQELAPRRALRCSINAPKSSSSRRLGVVDFGPNLVASGRN